MTNDFILTKKTLYHLATSYLEKYPTTTTLFKKRMIHKIKWLCLKHPGQDFEQAMQLLEQVTQTLIEKRILDDSLYLEAILVSFRNKGYSFLQILSKLQKKGFPKEQLQKAVLNDSQLEKESALLFFKKKKLSLKEPQKQLNALLRAGFNYEVAKQIIIFKASDP